MIDLLQIEDSFIQLFCSVLNFYENGSAHSFQANWLIDPPQGEQYQAGAGSFIPFDQPGSIPDEYWSPFLPMTNGEGVPERFGEFLKIPLSASSIHIAQYFSDGWFENLGWSCLWKRFRLRSAVPLPEEFTIKFALVEERSTQTNSWEVIEFDQPTRTVLNTIEVKIPKNGVFSNTFFLTPRTGFSGPLNLGRSVLYRLVPLEVTPEYVNANTNFDEGDVDAETGYAIPDCENGTLVAQRNHLDGKWNAGDLVIDDLNNGFFGIRPGVFHYEHGISAEIRKVNRLDTETGYMEAGHVKLWAIHHIGAAEHEEEILLYDPETLQPYDLGNRLYHTDPEHPITFYLEGTKPGKITLEFRYQHNDLSITFEQEFTVATRKSKQDWLQEIRYQLMLQSAVDLNHYLPYDGGWKPRPDPLTGSRSFVFHAERVRAIYDYYGQLFEQWPEKLDWMGAARMVGGAVYGGLCDIQASDPSISVKGKLMGGQILIYRDLAWQHRAYVASGIWALEWVDQNDSGAVNGLVNGVGAQGALVLDDWRDFDGAINSNDWNGIKDASRALVLREQQEVIAPMWAEMVVFDSGFVGSASNGAKNPVDPESPTFLEVVPNGSVANYVDRDRYSFGWTNSPKGVFPVWWGETESSGNPTAFYGPSTRLGLVRIPLRTRAALFSQFGTIY